MIDLKSNFIGIETPNPFWLASAPPTDKAYNVNRAFEAGWGGVMWKTLGEAGLPLVNVSGPRYGAWHGKDRTLMGLNNIELITDRDLEINLAEIIQVKKDWPDRGVVVSLMVPCEEQAWIDILRRVEDTGADGIELNFGCPHGMSERGMGAAVGQVPEYVEMVAAWCKQYSDLPTIVKLTPNITDIRTSARGAVRGGADAVSLINTINSVMGVDLNQLKMSPSVGQQGSHGGYCGPAVKPIALHMLSEIARDTECNNIPISGIGGITDWRDAAEFMALGASNVQVCTAVMTYGFRIVEDMIDGLSRYLAEQGMTSVDQLIGAAVPTVTSWNKLDLNYVVKAQIDQDSCIKCGRCHIACEDTSHQAISTEINGERGFQVKDEDCVGCNLCVVVCPVENCITLRELDTGEVDARTGELVSAHYQNWTQHPNNPVG
ncbi:NAD-dependent dihydropyrimidine dehydrogenase subunit PreA [Candidatus Njordibacter sp. Uisw_056]|jgi:dihydropyrimidine dehydrogenase (NAD+) subunit PreA|uniref:NAD-dependent dihydropyrimidine dehydrogenase subunit PreA n=1 Tax=Candidatus Njordibacter sp. Uisw_056 TaxID=3230973 RepID=UPI003D38CF5E|tara:strand:- start:3613 stop:4911 length:1299 start_codon:yes stop_codon:yes gene_type:complete